MSNTRTRRARKVAAETPADVSTDAPVAVAVADAPAEADMTGKVNDPSRPDHGAVIEHPDCTPSGCTAPGHWHKAKTGACITRKRASRGRFKAMIAESAEVREAAREEFRNALAVATERADAAAKAHKRVGSDGWAVVHVRSAGDKFANFLKAEHPKTWDHGSPIHGSGMGLVVHIGKSVEKSYVWAEVFAGVLNELLGPEYGVSASAEARISMAFPLAWADVADVADAA